MYPFIIISRNRKSIVEKLIDFALNQKIVSKVIIMDMGSEYPEMREYLRSLCDPRISISFLDNLGPRKLWISDEFRNCVGKIGFFLTDGDIDFSETETLVLQELVRVSKKYRFIRKVGCALRISDLPIDLDKSNLIFQSEFDNWSEYRLIEENMHLAPIDTTIAFYPKYSYDFHHWPSIRISGNFAVRHTPWYIDYANLNDEEEFYIQNAKGWGGFGTSSERGVRSDDKNFQDSRLFKYSRIIIWFLKNCPFLGSWAITRLINLTNNESRIKL
jgi:hypothetical protein